MIVYEKTLPQGIFRTYSEKPDFDFHYVKQIHSSIIKSCEFYPTEADGLKRPLTDKAPCAIVTADCLPILIIGKNDFVFIHAGWRGLHLDILKTKEVLEIGPHYAFIGPAISKKNYQVSEDFKDNFPNSKAFSIDNGQYFFDLSYEAKDQLLSLFPSIIVECSHTCTYENTIFHSYRRNQTTLRNWNLYFPQSTSMC